MNNLLNVIQKKVSSIDKKNYWIVTGVACAFLAIFSLLICGMISGGKYQLQRGDLFETHVAYILSMFRNIIKGENIWYSYDVSMGMDTSLALAYYTMSPFNIIFLIFYKFDPNFALAIVLILKYAFCGAFFQLFLRYVLKVEDWKSIIFSMFYAFCGFNTVYCAYHIMWMDAVLALPLLLTVIIYSFKKNKFWPVVLCYAYLFVSQFYMAYMVGVFSFVFVILALFLYDDFREFAWKHMIKLFAKWCLSVFVAVLISAIVWLPALMFLLNNNPPDATTFMDLKIDLISVINSMFWGQFTDHMGGNSYSYSGLLPLILAPAFFASKQIKIKQKIFAAVALILLAVCYIVPEAYKFIHAFDAPDWFWFRFSFLLSFVAVSMGAMAAKHIEKNEIKGLIIWSLVLVLIYVIEQKYQSNYAYDKDKSNGYYNMLITFSFVVAWGILLELYLKKKLCKSIVIALFFLVSIIEITSNYYVTTRTKFLQSKFSNWYDALSVGVDYIKSQDDGFYRMIVLDDYIHNSDSYFGYNGISDFASCENYKLRKTLSNLGFGTTPRMTYASGYTPVTEMLLGVKYELQVRHYSDYDDDKYGIDELFWYSPVNNNLGVGYLVDDDILSFSFADRNVFENMDTLLKNMTGNDEKCFYEVDKESIEYEYNNARIYQLDDSTNGEYYMDKSEEGGCLYINVEKNDEFEAAYIQFEEKEAQGMFDDFEVLNASNDACPGDMTVQSSSAIMMREDEKNYNAYVQSFINGPSTITFDAINIYYFDRDALDVHYDILKNNQLYIDEYKNGYIKGRVNNSEEGKVLFVSVPYDEKWSVKINGIDGEIVPVLGEAFMAIVLPDEGEVEIELKYSNPAVNKGIIISGIGLGTLMLMIAIENRRKKSEESLNAEME